MNLGTLFAILVEEVKRDANETAENTERLLNIFDNNHGKIPANKKRIRI